MQTGEQIFREVWNSCRDYHLIDDSDKILVGLSGGKDSMALIEMLGQMQKANNPRFSVVAAHIAMDTIDYGVDSEALSRFCEGHGVAYIYKRVTFLPDPLGKNR
ncbi:MAG: ATP-binding protein, partial [Bacteroidales bacterium]